MTAPFPTFPCGGCSLIPTSSSVQTHKAWREVGKDFLPPPAVPCIPSQTVLRETPCCSQHLLHSWHEVQESRAVGRTDTVSTSICINLPNMEFNLKLVLRFTDYVHPIQPSQARMDGTKPRQFHLKFSSKSGPKRHFHLFWPLFKCTQDKQSSRFH